MPYTPPVTSPRIVYCRNCLASASADTARRYCCGWYLVETRFCVELGLVDHPAGQLDGVRRVAVELALPLRATPAPTSVPSSLSTMPHVGRHVLARVGLGVQAAAGPAGDLRTGRRARTARVRSAPHALAAVAHSRKDDVACSPSWLTSPPCSVDDVEVLLGGRVRVGLLERRERRADVDVVGVAGGVPVGERLVVEVGVGDPDRVVVDLRGGVEEVLEVRVRLARVVDDLGAAVLQPLGERLPVGLAGDVVLDCGQSRNSKPNVGERLQRPCPWCRWWRRSCRTSPPPS